VDAFRFYVIRELDIGPDGNWTDEGFRARYSSELATVWAISSTDRSQCLSDTEAELCPKDFQRAGCRSRTMQDHNNSLAGGEPLQGALQSIWHLVTSANQYR
jgi:methionyl-tRNA synthetase